MPLLDQTVGNNSRESCISERQVSKHDFDCLVSESRELWNLNSKPKTWGKEMSNVLANLQPTSFSSKCPPRGCSG